MQIYKSLRLDWIYPLLLGTIAFWMVAGFTPINPQNIGWLLGRLDPTQHYLGWDFYRHADWTSPIGLNPKFGLDISSSIVYSDSIPLLAIPLKLISPLLPSQFQYLGPWIFLCFILQSWCAWKIAGLFCNDNLLRILASVLFIFCPPLLWRLNTPAGGHAALLSHFFILWALYLSLASNQTRKTLMWSLLFSASVLTHFYLFAIVSVIWLTDLACYIYIQKTSSGLKRAFNEFIIIISCVLICAWQAGYFTIAATLNNERGYGFYGMNVLGPLDPQGWSYIIGEVTNPSDWGEGFSYLGLGLIAAILFALIGSLRKSQKGNIKYLNLGPKFTFFLLMAAGLIIFSISNRIGLGNYSISLSIPAWAISKADILRSSARMFWPVYYLITIATFVLIIQGFSKRSATLILSLCIAIQIIDTSRGWLNIRNSLAVDKSYEINPPKLSNPFWNEAASHYQNIVLAPALDMPPNWEQFAMLATKYRLGTNSIHMARIDIDRQYAANKKLDDQINTGNFDRSTLYIVEDRYVIAASATKSSDSVLARINDLNVLAPGWDQCNDCPTIKNSLLIKSSQFSPHLMHPIYFSTGSPYLSYYLRSGWSWPESWGTWSDNTKAILNFSWPSKRVNTLNLVLNAFQGGEVAQNIKVSINGQPYQKYSLAKETNNEITIVFSAGMKAEKYLSVEFEIESPKRPYDISINNGDKRKLGIGIISATFK